MARTFVALFVFTLAGCGGHRTGTTDAGTRDASRRDGGSAVDSGPFDAGGTDAGGNDAGGTDAGSIDAGPGRDGGGIANGEVCMPGGAPCAEGLSCCYPCGIPDCDYRCEPTCAAGTPGCTDGCMLRP